MTAIRSVGRRALGSDTESSQSLLQHSYFIAAIAVVLALVIFRLVVLRWRNQTLSDFFRIGPSSQYRHDSQQDDTNFASAPYGAQLSVLPTAYHPGRRIHALDTDAHGRRLGAVGEGWNGKDALPAYDGLDRPPKYIEAGWPHGHFMGQSAVVPSLEGGQSGPVV